MRDAHPLVGNQLIVGQIGVVLFVQVGVHGVQAFDGERFAALGHLVAALLELGEHRLAEHGAAEGIQQAVKQVGLRAVLRVTIHQLHQHQHLVHGRGDLGDEQRVFAL